MNRACINSMSILRKSLPCVAYFCMLVLSSQALSAAIKSSTGTIKFDRNNDGNPEMSLNSTGLGVGTTTPSANLHVAGNAVVTGDLSVGGSTVASSNLHVQGSIGMNYQTISSDSQNILSSWILADSSSDNITLTLPNASGVSGYIYNIKKISTSNTVTVVGGESLDGNYNVVLQAGSLGSLKVYASNDKWYILEMSSDGTQEGFSWLLSSANLLLWLDASDSSTITHSGNVSQWDDKSGNNNHVSQGTASKQPTTGTRTVNGLNVIDFDGGDYLEKTSFSVPSSGNIAIFAVADIDTINDVNDSIFCMDATNDFQFDSVSGSQFDGAIDVEGTVGSDVNLNGGPFEALSIYNVNFDFTGSGVYNAFINGTHRTASSYSNKLDVSQTLRIMANRSSLEAIDGAIAEFIVTEDCTSETRQQIEGYLAHKWGIASSLSSIHPYLNQTSKIYPTINSTIADDQDNLDVVLSTGDNLTLVFDGATNQPAVSTKTDIDNLIDFGGNTLGTDYSGAWNTDGDTLVITVGDATGGNLAIGQTLTILYGGNLTYAGNSVPSVASHTLDGDFGDLKWSAQYTSTLLWLDASDTSTITESGGAVSQWADKSENDNHVSQGTGSAQPSTGIRTVNALNVIDFDGDDYLEKTSFPVPSSGNMAIFAVADIDDISIEHDAIFSMDATNDFQFDAANNSQFNGAIDQDGIGTDVGLTGGPFESLSIYNVNFDNTGSGVYNAFIDGTQRAVDTSYTNNLDVSQSLKIMSNRSGANPIDGAFAECVIIEDCTSETRQQIEGYLAWKWGIESSLPTTHTYKSQKPMRYPIILSATADDPNADFAGVDAGDNITLVFDGTTNTPPVSNKTEIDTLLSFGANVLGSAYSGTWNGAGNTLVITVDNASGNAMSIGQDLTILSGGNLTFTGNSITSTANINLGGSFDP